MTRDVELPVIRAAYELLVGLIPAIGKFPRDLRFTLGEKIEQQALATLELLIRARYARNRAALLDQANVELEVLRYQLRAAHDLKALPTKTFARYINGLVEVGSQVGGWRKACLQRSQD